MNYSHIEIHLSTEFEPPYSWRAKLVRSLGLSQPNRIVSGRLVAYGETGVQVDNIFIPWTNVMTVRARGKLPEPEPVRRLEWIQGEEVASAPNLVLGRLGNSFKITGTIPINLLSAENWRIGSVVKLTFTDVLTVKSDTPSLGYDTTIRIASGEHFITSPGATLTLYLVQVRNERRWVEIDN